MIKAILFDLDGVLIETEQETFKFYQDYLKEKGINLKDSDFKYKAGRKSVDFWNDVLTYEQIEVIDTKKLTELKRDLFNTNPEKYVKKVAGGKELLSNLKKQGFKLALTTQNEKRMADTSMDWLGIRNLFDVILSLQDITKKKPDPEIYLLTADKLNLNPSECIVIEDSKDGVNSAKNANMICIAFGHPYTPKGDLDNADIQIIRLNEITPKLIQNLSK